MSEIWHHGILGMKWGVRRFQNKDGSLTAAGRKRYLNDDGSFTKKGEKELSDDQRKKITDRNEAIKNLGKRTDEALAHIHSLKPGSKEKAEAEKKFLEEANDDSPDSVQEYDGSPAMKIYHEIDKKFGDYYRGVGKTDETQKLIDYWQSRDNDNPVNIAKRKEEEIRKSLLAQCKKRDGTIDYAKRDNLIYYHPPKEYADALEKLSNEEGKMRKEILGSALKAIGFEVNDANIKLITDFVFTD